MKKTLILFALLSTITSCEMFDDPGYDVDPRLARYLEKFYAEAAARGITFDSRVKAYLRDIDEVGRSVKNKHRIEINRNFFESNPDKNYRIELIVFHEMAHSLLGRKHRDDIKSIMNTSPNIDMYQDDLELRKKYVDELFN